MGNWLITFVARRLRWDPDHDRARIVALLVGVSVILVASASALPIWRTLRSWRVHRLVVGAEALMVQGDWQAASRKASAALVLESRNPAALRTAARAQTLGDRPVAIPLWKAYFNTGRANVEEIRNFIPLAIRFGAYDLARAELMRLLPGHWSDAELLFFGAQIAAGVRDFDESLRYDDLAVQMGATNHQYRLFGAMLRTQLPNPAERQRARATLLELASLTNNVGLQAMELLNRSFKLSADEQSTFLRQLQQRPLQGPGERLLELGLALGASPADRHNDILETALRTWGGEDAIHRAALGGWANGRRLYEFALRVVPDDQSVSDARLFTVHLDALAGLGRWERVVTCLELPKNPLSKVVSEAYRARSAAALKDSAMAAVHWRRALQAAGDEPNELAFVAGYASAAGEVEQAGAAYRRLAEVAPTSWEARSAFSSFLQRHGTTVELRDCIRSMSRQWPDHSALRNDLAYLNLLLGTELDVGLETARNLVQQFPESVPNRATLALALVRRQEFTQAWDVFVGRDVDWRLALPGHRAVYVAVLLGTGRTAEAGEQARQIEAARLRPEELALVAPARGR